MDQNGHLWPEIPTHGPSSSRPILVRSIKWKPLHACLANDTWSGLPTIKMTSHITTDETSADTPTIAIVSTADTNPCRSDNTPSGRPQSPDNTPDGEHVPLTVVNATAEDGGSLRQLKHAIPSSDQDSPKARSDDLGETSLTLRLPVHAPVTEKDRIDFTSLKQVVRSGLDQAHLAEHALMEIRDRRLWREKHATFDLFCREEFDLSEARVSQMVQCANEIAFLEDQNVPKELIPTTERAIRELRRAKRADRVQVLQLAAQLAKDQPPNSTTIAKARAQIAKASGNADGQDEEEGNVKVNAALKAAEKLNTFLKEAKKKDITFGTLEQLQSIANEIQANTSRLATA